MFFIVCEINRTPELSFVMFNTWMQGDDWGHDEMSCILHRLPGNVGNDPASSQSISGDRRLSTSVRLQVRAVTSPTGHWTEAFYLPSTMGDVRVSCHLHSLKTNVTRDQNSQTLEYISLSTQWKHQGLGCPSKVISLPCSVTVTQTNCRKWTIDQLCTYKNKNESNDVNFNQQWTTCSWVRQSTGSRSV